MVEIRRSLSSIEEWREFRASLFEIATIGASVREYVEKHGFIEPMTGERRLPWEIKINPENLHESISACELNSRKRALILQIVNELAIRGWRKRKDLRILSADGLTRLAMILRGRYPYFYGGEYLPTEQAKKEFFPIPHLDLQAVDLPDERFDLFVSGDVFEHLPFLDKALSEIHRVLKPGGALVSSFPFVPQREVTQVRASLSESGEVTHHEPPEYHGNPVDRQAGSLVFRMPGWDILDTLKEIGFADAYFTVQVSSHYGVASNSAPGPFILTAVKSAPNGPPRRRPPDFVNRITLPEALCTLVALPRSGTTVITSVFSVHSKFAAVFEPWNAMKDFEKLPPTIDALARHARLPDLGGKNLFVKETAANLQYVANLRKLVEATPDFIPRHVLVVLRSPAQTFISEVSRRSEWWGADVTVNRESFKNWLAKSRVALRHIIQFATQYDGVVIALGVFASHPRQVLEALGQRIGFDVEPAQLEYEKHLDLKIVHGDRNVGQAPAPIDVSKVNFRDESASLIQSLIVDEAERRWFDAFSEFYELAETSGGVMPVSSLPAALRSILIAPE